MVCLTLGTINADATGTFLMSGLARDDNWAWTVGKPLFISETAGQLTDTAPSDPGDFIRIVAVAGPTGDYLYFYGNLDWGEL
jgi:hypothetical protein